MASYREVGPKPTIVPDGRYALVRLRKADRDRLERHLFQRYPDREWGTFFRFGFRRTSWGIALSFVDAILPEPGDLDRQSAVTVFKDQYILRAMKIAERRELVVGAVHSHPEGFFVRPSPSDDDMDLYFAREFASYGNGAPYVSLIFQRNPITGFSFSGRVHDRGEWLPVSTMCTVGTNIERVMAEGSDRTDAAASRISNGVGSTTARLNQLLSDAAANKLRAARIGIIGCSGTGSPAIEVLARAGVGVFVLVDPQRFGPSNLERVHGAFTTDLDSDLPPFKVEIQRRHIKAINPNAKTTAMVGNVLHENTLDELLRCDAILGCSDSVHGRVFLSDIAKHYLMPIIDVAVGMEGRNGRLSSQTADITAYSPDLPCAFCNDLLNFDEMTTELMTDEEKEHRKLAARLAAARGDNPDHYWRDERQRLTVGYVTSMLGSLAAGYLIGGLTGAFEMPGAAFQFDIGKPNFGFTNSLPSAADCNCKKHIGWADQARHRRNVARPNHWPAKATMICRD